MPRKKDDFLTTYDKIRGSVKHPEVSYAAMEQFERDTQHIGFMFNRPTKKRG